MRTYLKWLLIVILPVAVRAQMIDQNRNLDTQETPILTVRSQLVAETITVKDRSGKPVNNLTSDDFTLTEDGVPQKIRSCEQQELPNDATPLPAASANYKITVYKTLNRTQISSDNLNYKDRRLIALYFDMSAMNDTEEMRTLRAAITFVRSQMTPVDLISILRYSLGSVDVLQDFTGDRNRLLSILTTLEVGENREWATKNSDASSPDTGAAFGQDDGEFNIFNTTRQLSALQTATNMLGHLNEKKVLVYFASGVRLNGLDNQAQLHATVDAAIRAGVSIWPVDARGLVANVQPGDASQGSPGNIDVYSGLAEQEAQSDFQQSQDTLYSLAGDTGGKALLNTNDLTRGITQAQRSISNYYVLSYYTTNTELDGRFRRIKITVNHPAAVKLEYRQGYFAKKEFAKFTPADKERQLEDALLLEEPITDLAIAMELNYFQLNRAEYFLPLVVKIPGNELELARRHGSAHALVDIIGEIKNAYDGTTVTNLRDKVDVAISGLTEANLTHMPIEYDTGFTLLPGAYRIKLLARDNETGRIGTYETTFNIPNLNKEQEHVPISSVVLSTQQIPIHDVLFSAMETKDRTKKTSADPLVFNGMKLIPSVTRVFSRNYQLHVLLQGYEPGVAQPKPLIAFVSFYRDRAMQFRSQPVAVTPSPSPQLKVVHFNFNISLNLITPGDYICQVTVLDPTDGKSTFWRTTVKITN